MNDTLRRFLSARTPAASEDVVWLHGEIRLRLDVYLTSEPPPLELVTSVRALLASTAGWAVLPVFLARGEPESGFGGDPDRYEERVQFVAERSLDAIELPAVQRVLLTAALQIVT